MLVWVTYIAQVELILRIGLGLGRLGGEDGVVWPMRTFSRVWIRNVG